MSRTVSRERIWGEAAENSQQNLRHFLVLLGEATFECIAIGLKVKRYCPSFEEALVYASGELMRSDAE